MRHEINELYAVVCSDENGEFDSAAENAATAEGGMKLLNATIARAQAGQALGVKTPESAKLVRFVRAETVAEKATDSAS